MSDDKNNTPPAGAPPATPPAAPPAAPPATPSVAGTPPSTPPASPPAAPPAVPPDAPNFPENWRETYAKGDDKKLAQLKRFSSYESALDSLFEAQKKIAQGLQKPKLADKATPEQLAEYRAAVGVPETADKYDTALADGHVWGEADKPLLESFTKAAHDANVPGEYVKPMLAWYDQLQQKQLEERTLKDAGWKKQNLDALAAEWGGNMGMEARIADEFWQSMGTDMYERFKAARDAEGNLLFADAELIRWSNRMQRDLNPAGTVLPGSGINSLQAAEARKSEIEKMIADPSSGYYKGEKVTKNGRTDTKVAWEYYDLLAALERQKGRKVA